MRFVQFESVAKAYSVTMLAENQPKPKLWENFSADLKFRSSMDCIACPLVLGFRKWRVKSAVSRRMDFVLLSSKPMHVMSHS